MDAQEMAKYAAQLKRDTAPTIVKVMARPDCTGFEAHVIMLSFATEMVGHVLSFYDLSMRETLLENLIENVKKQARDTGGSLGVIAQHLQANQRR